jgi:sister-chromatid-cohesion protein PDS5
LAETQPPTKTIFAITMAREKGQQAAIVASRSRGKGKSLKENDAGNDLDHRGSLINASSTSVARRLTAELQRLRGLSNGELDLEEAAALGQNLSSETFLEHQDPHIRLLVASCVAELLRVTAPETPFASDMELYDVFVLIVRVLRETTTKDDTDVAWFGLLETLATVKSCNLVVGLDVEMVNHHDRNQPTELVVDLFRCLFERLQDNHSSKVEANMVSIMVGCLEESDAVSSALLETLLEPLLDASKPAYRMAQQVIEKASDQLQSHLRLFFNSVLVDASTVQALSDLKDHVHTLIYEVHKINPSLLFYVLPNVCLQLQVDDVDTRAHAIAVMGRLFSSSHADYGSQYMKNFREFLGRFRDVDKRIRLQMVHVAKMILVRKPDLAPLIESELMLRLNDPEWEVRQLAVEEICEVCMKDATVIRDVCLREVGERMKDKKIVIRKEAMTGLAQVYAHHHHHYYPDPSHERQDIPPSSSSASSNKFEWIPGYVLKCFAYPQPELKLRVVKLLDDILLPSKASEDERMVALVSLWKGLDASAREALRRIQIERAMCRRQLRSFLEIKTQMHHETSPSRVAHATHVLMELFHAYLPEMPVSDTKHITEKLVLWKDKKFLTQWRLACSDNAAEAHVIRHAREEVVKMGGSKTPVGETLKHVCRKAALTTFNTSSIMSLLAMLEAKISKESLAAVSDLLQLVAGDLVVAPWNPCLYPSRFTIIDRSSLYFFLARVPSVCGSLIGQKREPIRSVESSNFRG